MRVGKIPNDRCRLVGEIETVEHLPFLGTYKKVMWGKINSVLNKNIVQNLRCLGIKLKILEQTSSDCQRPTDDSLL